MSSALDQLRSLSTIVVDSGDLDAIARARPVDATTNPSLILKAVESDNAVVAQWIEEVRGATTDVDRRRWMLGARFASRIQDDVERWVSLEADATLSFDTAATIACAETLLDEVASAGGDPRRILIKIAATWEGIRAAQVLESRGIACNLTLIFSRAQAQLCAAGGITLISPFVGRISDWHRAQGAQFDHAEDDPGVASVRGIDAWCKAHGYGTLVMGASFRNTGQILALAGCDALTIAPDLLQQLADSEQAVEPGIQRHGLSAAELAETPPDASAYALVIAEDAMAAEKLAEGIRRFAADQRALEARLQG